MKKRIFIGILAAMFMTAASVSLPADVSSTAYAAKGGARISAPKISAPKAATPAPKTNTQTAPKDSPNTKPYAPSKDAKSYSDTAPTTGAKAATGAAAAQKSSTGWGNTLRTMGLFAGGMMLGGLIGNALGLGGGIFGDILGLVLNVFIIGLVLMVVMSIVRKIFGKKSASSYSNARTPRQRTESAPQGQNRIIDITPRDGYDAKNTADKYRNR